MVPSRLWPTLWGEPPMGLRPVEVHRTPARRSSLESRQGQQLRHCKQERYSVLWERRSSVFTGGSAVGFSQHHGTRLIGATSYRVSGNPAFGMWHSVQTQAPVPSVARRDDVEEEIVLSDDQMSRRYRAVPSGRHRTQKTMDVNEMLVTSPGRRAEGVGFFLRPGGDSVQGTKAPLWSKAVSYRYIKG